jgi:NADPH:quinone reductase-like Zn-dependent oxidoreductase
MKSYQVNYGGGLESLKVIEKAIPEPGPGQVLVKVHANSFNFRELNVLRGTYPLPVKPTLTPISDGAGEIVAVGEGVTRTKIGDRIAAHIFPHWIDGPFGWEYSAQIGGSLDGMLTEYTLLSEEAVVLIPDHLSYMEAAALPCAGVTAWNAVTGGLPIKAGDTVLTLGSGGVSLFALQFAKLSGARVIATTSSEEKGEQLKALGADEIVNYRQTPDWHVPVHKLTGGRGVDKVIEIGSGAFESSIRATAVEGQISMIGRPGILPSSAPITSSQVESAQITSTQSASTQTDTSPIPTPNPSAHLQPAPSSSLIDLNTLFMSVASIRAIAVGSRAQFIAMNRAIAANQMRPVIDRVFPFADAHAAYKYYMAGKYFGKVVISHD